MKIFSRRRSMVLSRPLPEVFAFFAEARNLEALTPDWLELEVLTPPPITMATGLKIDYRLRRIPICWQSEITRWEPPHRFVDEQTRGPYRLWVHEHRFEEQAHGTLAEDRVQYAVHGGWVVERLIVRRDLDTIFEYRRMKLRELLGIAPTSDAAGEQRAP